MAARLITNILEMAVARSAGTTYAGIAFSLIWFTLRPEKFHFVHDSDDVQPALEGGRSPGPFSHHHEPSGSLCHLSADISRFYLSKVLCSSEAPSGLWLGRHMANYCLGMTIFSNRYSCCLYTH
jgi:hypothetical protein